VEATIQRARELVKEAREEIAAVERENQGNDIARRTAIDAARAESKKKVEKELAKLRGKTVEWRLTVARVSQVGSEDALYVEELPDAAAPGNEAGVYIVFPREFIRGLGGMFTHNSYLKVGEEVSRSLAERLRPGDHIVVKGSARVACGIGASGLHVLDPTFDVVIELINVIVEDADATLSRHFEGNVPPGRTVASPPPEPVERSRPIPPPAYHAPRHSQEAPRSRGNVGRTNAPVAPPHAVAPTVNLAVAPFDAVKAKECQEAWAGRLNVPAEMSDSIGMRLVLIPAGEFMMGSSAEEISLLNASARQDGRKAKSPNSSNEVPQHRVRITRPFYMGAYHVTRGQFQKFVAQSGYRTDAEKDGKGGNGIDLNGHTEQKREYTWRNPGFEQADNHPVLNVSWNDAVAFCRWLSGQESAVYRLPTEAEWEYACRAGTTTRYHNGDEDETLIEVANIADATCKAQFPSFKSTVATSDGYVFTSPVGGFKPNAFGLFDMHGNVCQWCEDWYEREYYSISPVDDPQGPDSGSRRVDRGGSWITVARGCRSANRRGGFPPDSRYDNVGFRVVRAAVVPTEAETAGARRATGTQAGGDGTKRSPSE
jgi:formylglycine-generating enzyme required for sulfatase activity